MSFLNPWVILGVLLAVLGAGGAGYYKGNEHAKTAALAEAAKQRSIDDVIEAGIARGVSQIKVTNTTIKQSIQGKTIEVPVYRECHHDSATLGLLNDILTGKPSAVGAGDSKLPATDPAD